MPPEQLIFGQRQACEQTEGLAEVVTALVQDACVDVISMRLCLKAASFLSPVPLNL